MADFFTQAHSSVSVALPASTPVLPPLQEFARALDSRNAPTLVVGSLPTVPTKPMAGLRLTSTPPRPGPSQPASASDSSAFRAVAACEVGVVMAQPSTLILDIRPNASFSSSRLPGAISLSVPSTLLKRPAFSLQKLSTMMRSTSRDRFLLWPDAGTILVYDSDTAVLSEGNNILGLLRKFKAAGYAGDIAWIRGGFTAVWKTARDLTTQAAPSDESESGEDDSPAASEVGTGFLRAQNLSMSAFQQSTTTGVGRPAHKAAVSSSSPVAHAGVAVPLDSTRLTAANPFFNNIRQNVELAQGITERIPLRLSPDVLARARRDLPFKWLRDIVTRSEDEEAEMLAMQFYKIELGEQRRMQGIMQHHSRNVPENSVTAFPYSISAAIEKGTKNRYRDIYPFEHSRVKLCGAGHHSNDGSDYINANFINPIGTDKRYIATQGPLPATFTDFWTLCWEQNASVIVMLTRQVEGAQLKCGAYWTEQQFGSLSLVPISVSGPTEDLERNLQAQSGGFNFGVEGHKEAPAKFDPATSVIQRKFWLSNTAEPLAKRRLVTQLQYLSWPDVNVPDDADGLLWLINAADKAAEESFAVAGQSSPTPPPRGPLVLHCSAGVGRTGGYIAVDAVLDALRRELRENNPSAMQVDSNGSSSSSSAQSVPCSNNITPPSGCESSSGSLDSPPVSAAHLSRNLLLSQRPAPHVAHLRTNESSAGDESSANELSSNPRVFDSTVGLTASPSVTSLDAESSEDVSMDEKSGDEPPLSEADGAHSDSETMSTPNNMEAQSFFDAARITAKRAVASSSHLPARAPPATLELHSSSAFDYAAPRNTDAGPLVRLATLEDPIHDVLDDMRKQRMSLCQALRQYVFIHRAIIEGALAIVDEDMKRGGSPSTTLPAADNDSLAKRSSLKRKQRATPDDDDASLVRAQRSGSVRR